jgi:RNA-directed DNA polymerase
MASPLITALRKSANLERSWRLIHANGRTSRSEGVKLELEAFAEDASHNLRSLQARLVKGSFRFPKAKGVPIPKLDQHGRPTGKIRPIVLAPVESRIVQRAVLNVLLEVEALRPFAETRFSFGGIRGAPKGSGGRRTTPRAENISAVPAAIQAVLDGIKNGGRFIACADIQAFFTKVPKSNVTDIVGRTINDPEFLAFFRSAIDVELANLAELRSKAGDFPIEDIGVAQGNSLSPLLGNIILADFDAQMNEGDCRCVRYIDDFIIIAPTQKAANARLRRAISILSKLGMDLSPEKSSTGGTPIEDGFDFVGINICPGLIRPSAKAQAKFLNSVQTAFEDGAKAMRGLASGASMDRRRSLIGTLKRVDGMIDGWGKHYWFCNDAQAFETTDGKISAKLGAFLGEYRDIRGKLEKRAYAALLGMAELSAIEREPFVYPRQRGLQT